MTDASPPPEAFREALAEPSGAAPQVVESQALERPASSPEETQPTESAPVPPSEPPLVAPTPEPIAPQPAAPESPPDPRATRRYLPHAISILFLDRRLEGTYYMRDASTVDIEGTFGADSFDSIEQLINMAHLTNEQRDAFITRTTSYLTMARQDRSPFTR